MIKIDGIDEKEQTVIHSVLGALWPNMVGTKVVRKFEFKNNDTIILSTLNYEAIATEKPIMRYLTWSRIISPLDLKKFPF